MSKKNRRSPHTSAARLNGFWDRGSGGVVPPMQASTTFVRDENYDLAFPENTYGRDHNDQVRLAEAVLCNLEGGAETLLFASGMAAIATLVSSLRRGQKLLLQSGIYWGSTAWIRGFCERREIVLVEADSSDSEAFCERITQDKPDMVFIEVPSNPWIRLSDIPKIAEAVHQHDALLAVDATAATPVLMQPISFGADVVMHSATKAINGHSDVLAGVLTCGNADLSYWRHVKAERAGGGAILSSQAAWLLLRGMRTLPLRVRQMCENALKIARFLNTHDAVEAVWYPGLESHREHDLAKRLMPDSFGYLLSFLVKGGKDEALSFCGHLEGIHRATSLGGTESLVEHRHSVEGELTGCPENLIRLSVGIEDVDDLIGELDSALQRI